jgi:hypothetical protein
VLKLRACFVYSIITREEEEEKERRERERRRQRRRRRPCRNDRNISLEIITQL